MCACVYTNRENITVISVSLPLATDFLRQLSPPYAFLFATLPSDSLPLSLSLSFSSSSLCRPSVSSSRGLDEKSEYATIFKWQPRDTLLNALFASPPTSPRVSPFYRPLPLCIGRRSTVLFGCRPDRDEHVARCLIKNSPTKPSL